MLNALGEVIVLWEKAPANIQLHSRTAEIGQYSFTGKIIGIIIDDYPLLRIVCLLTKNVFYSILCLFITGVSHITERPGHALLTADILFL